MAMAWAPFRTQCHTALLTVARTLPLFMDVPFTGPFSGLDAAVYHTEEAVDAPLEADAAEVSASGDGGGRYREVMKEFILLLSDGDRKKAQGR
jgi:hypothetical protein